MRFQVILPDGVVEDARRPRLVEELRRISADVFGAAAPASTVDFTEIGSGRFFTAAKPSRSSLIGVGVPPGTAQADRVRLMSEITAMWCDVTGCAANDVVVSAADT